MIIPEDIGLSCLHELIRLIRQLPAENDALRRRVAERASMRFTISHAFFIQRCVEIDPPGQRGRLLSRKPAEAGYGERGRLTLPPRLKPGANTRRTATTDVAIFSPCLRA